MPWSPSCLPMPHSQPRQWLWDTTWSSTDSCIWPHLDVQPAQVQSHQKSMKVPYFSWERNQPNQDSCIIPNKWCWRISFPTSLTEKDRWAFGHLKLFSGLRHKQIMSDEGWDGENGTNVSLLYIHQTDSLRGEGNKVISLLHIATASAVPRRKMSQKREVPFHTSILMVEVSPLKQGRSTSNCSWTTSQLS